mgnify:CR=1 FL=1
MTEEIRLDTRQNILKNGKNGCSYKMAQHKHHDLVIKSEKTHLRTPPFVHLTTWGLIEVIPGALSLRFYP